MKVNCVFCFLVSALENFVGSYVKLLFFQCKKYGGCFIFFRLFMDQTLIIYYTAKIKNVCKLK